MSTEEKPIVANVVRILDQFTILIDAGYKQGIVMGMKMVIFSEGEEIKGLEGENLGRVEHPKAQVEVIHVQEKLSMAKSSEKEYVNDPTLAIASALSSISYYRRKELPVDLESIRKIATVDNTVKVGDKVKQLEVKPKCTSADDR